MRCPVAPPIAAPTAAPMTAPAIAPAAAPIAAPCFAFLFGSSLVLAQEMVKRVARRSTESLRITCSLPPQRVAGLLICWGCSGGNRATQQPRNPATLHYEFA